MSLRYCLTALTTAAVCLAPLAAQEKDKEAKVKVEVHLSDEHTPGGLKAGTRVDLVMIIGSVKAPNGKVKYDTRKLAEGADVVAVKREEKPADPTRPVLVELNVTKAQADKVNMAKMQVVDVTESVGGQPVTRKATIPLRLELLKPKE